MISFGTFRVNGCDHMNGQRERKYQKTDTEHSRFPASLPFVEQGDHIFNILLYCYKYHTQTEQQKDCIP